MMQITLKSTILIDNDRDVMTESHPCDWTIKPDSHYLHYQNDDQEKVVIKLKADELVMTRFSQPTTTMRFVKGGLATASIPTPMGIQQLITKTKVLDYQEQSVRLSYELLVSEDDTKPLAAYQLELSWE